MSYDTETLAGVINGMDPFEPFLLAMFFPEVITFESSTIDIDVVAPDTGLAPFVSPMVSGKADTANGFSTNKFKPAYVKPKDVVDPERVLSRRPGESIGGGLTAGQRNDAIIADIIDNQRKKIIRRWEWMAAQALLTGKVTVSGEDYKTVEVDFQRTAGNTITLAGLDVWTDTVNATPLQDLEDWNDIAEAPITDYIMDSTSFTNLMKFTAVKDLLDTRRGSESMLEMGPDNAKWVSFKGWLGSYRIWVYKGYYTDSVGVKTNFIPANTVIGVSSAVEGVRGFGAILDGKGGYQAMEMFPKNWQNDDPAVEYAMTQSAPLMIPRRPDAVVAITTA
ncbi:MAG: major capsid protein [Gammaproteobacteria bacterium]|nr:major capsid protein [Gammaproteobacteria bacterium]